MKTTMILTTDRLYMRPLTTKDTDALLHLWTLPEVRKNVWNDRVLSRDAVETEIKSSLSSFDEAGWGLWGLCLKSDPYRVVGFCGLKKRNDDVEMVVGLDPEFWKMGLASEGAAKIIDYCFRQLQVPQIWSFTDPSDDAGTELLHRLGLALSHQTDDRRDAFVLTQKTYLQS